MISIFFSASFYNYRWITIISILFLNPFPFIAARPIQILTKNSQLSRKISLTSTPKNLIFEGLLGCKYDIEICNINEACFDDDLFGQCWDGEGSVRKAFVVPNGLDGISKEKFLILEYTIDFLNRYNLQWRDFMTQCFLSHILINNQPQFSRNRLQFLYEDCLKKDEILDKIEDKNFHRREIYRNYPSRYLNSYIPLFQSGRIYLDNLPNGPLFIGFDDRRRLPSSIHTDRVLVDDDDIDLQTANPITEEFNMNKPSKFIMETKESYPGLYETLQINNNKQFIPKPIIDKTIDYGRHKNNTDAERYFTVEAARGYLIINRNFKDQSEGADLLYLLAQINTWPTVIFDEVNTNQRILTYHIADNPYRINASYVAQAALHHQNILANQMNLRIIDSGIGNPNQGAQLSVERQNVSRPAILALLTCALVLFIMLSFVCLYYLKRNELIRKKLTHITRIKGLPTDSYQDLCRQHMHEQITSRMSSEIHTVIPVKQSSEGSSTPSSRSSVSSWTEESTTKVNMDVMTGHLILSYMEDHLRNRHRLETEWESLCAEEINDEQAPCSIALLEVNERKNRYRNCIPYDHTRIRLENDLDEDYINASKITDSDPKCRYIATQGPMLNTTNAFWQMVWEQKSCVIVALTRPIENGLTMCHHYWPVEGSEQFNDYEVNLVSEHISSDEYVVRSFYLKNLQTMETRTVTQFHFLTWDEFSTPSSAKSVLDFRRKVNKCFRGRSSPIIVHCNDGVGRTGTYILLDIVLNRIAKGAREIDITATLEHIRDQRAKMVKTKEQFEFVFVAVAEEVTNLLQSLPH